MNNTFKNILLSLILSGGFVFAAQVFAHASSKSYAHWILDGNIVDVTLTIKLSDLNLLANFFEGEKADWQSRLASHIEQNIFLETPESSCSLSPENMHIEVANGYFQYRNRFQCVTQQNGIDKKANNEHLKITNNAFFLWDKSHMHIARLKRQDGNLQEHIFLDRQRQWLTTEIQTENLRAVSVPAFILLGFEHILSGWDHLAFLLALLLLCFASNSSWKTIALLITGFTLGHSSSLFLSMQQLLISDSLMVEAFIAWSILLLVFETRFQSSASQKYLAGFLLIAFLTYGFIGYYFLISIFPVLSLTGLLLFSLSYLYLGQRLQTEKSRVLLASIITIAFGFIHGLGFAGNLQTHHLSQESILPALFGFNVGVELGQLLVISIIFVTYKIVSKIFDEKYMGAANTAILLLLAFCATFWFIERSFY